MNELAIILDSSSRQHYYMQIYEYINKEIKEGRFLAGEKLPSTRFLAEHLQVSRSTVLLAYEQLIAEGYIETKPNKGYYINKIDNLTVLGLSNIKTIAKVNQDDLEEIKYHFSPFEIQKNGFPFSVWKRLQREVIADNESKFFEHGSAQGEEKLRSVIMRYLHASRGVECIIDQIIVGAGNDYLLLLLEKIMNNKITVAIENPSYERAYKIFKAAGYKVETICMDQNGINIANLDETESNLAYVMPAHQFPTGISMPISRRMELLNWANQDNERYIIEDDYDSEFRYKGKPIKSLQSLDKNGKVIYIGTFSKSIAPAIRVSYMVLPFDLLENYKERASFYSSSVSRIEQITLAKFIGEGYYERHLNKMRKIYKDKHDRVVQLMKRYSDIFDISGEQLGLHIILIYKGSKTREEIKKNLYNEKIKLHSMDDYVLKDLVKSEVQNKYLLGFANIESEMIEISIEALVRAFIK